MDYGGDFWGEPSMWWLGGGNALLGICSEVLGIGRYLNCVQQRVEVDASSLFIIPPPAITLNPRP